MCGIAGIFAYRNAANPVNPAELARIRDYMASRGPDGSGTWLRSDGRVGLTHRRLSVIDLSETGAQPMFSADGALGITFNGEIYNYRSLRLLLEHKGYIFRSASDTEVLLHLYAYKGADMVADLRGMFAFAIWDNERDSLFLARDPYGIKPLYYSDDGGTLRFASQVKALLAGAATSTDPDPAGVVGFHLFGFVPEPFTCFTSIRALPAGSSMYAGRGGLSRIREFFSLTKVYEEAESADAKSTSAAAVREALLDSVQNHLIADVPVGAFLSAGVDSGALVGLMRDSWQSEITTITLGFTEFENTQNDETPLAAEVGELYGTNHHKRLVARKEFEEDLSPILTAMDQPSIDGINTWFVSKAARELGLKVAISGLGGDELFGGYPSFRQVPRLVSLMKWPAKVPLLPQVLRRLTYTWLEDNERVSPKWSGIAEYGGSVEGAYLLRKGLFMPWELPSIIGREMAEEGLRRLSPLRHISAVMGTRLKSDFSKIAVLEAVLYMRNQLLRDADWASMAHSIELRVPLVDSMLLKACAPYIVGYSRGSMSRKPLLASSPTVPLPTFVTNRAKTGFSTPLGAWTGKILERSLPSAQVAQSRYSSRRLAPLVMRAASALKRDTVACASWSL